jgi:hypothetical protein
MKRVIAAAALILSLISANFVFGQGNLANATLQGRVFDQTGAVIPGASVELMDLNKGTRSTAVSDSSGYYSFPHDGIARQRHGQGSGNGRHFHETGYSRSDC